MALTGSDLLVVQQQTGGQDIKSLSITDLKTFLDTQSPLNFKGTANMTVGADEPAVSDRVAGNVYINSATAAGTFAWTGGTAPYTGTVQPNAQAVWVDTTGWQISNNSVGDVGVEAIESTLPITVDSTDASTPRISVNDATTAAVGVVQIATDVDVSNATPGLVVTSAQLAATNAAISAAGGGTVISVAGTAPIVVTGDATATPTVTITNATTDVVGAVQLQDASAIAGTVTTKATTPKYVGDFYLIKDFSSLPSI